jgi:aryl-alcohol dehydrogenase-like predicted oxidoreductase
MWPGTTDRLIGIGCMRLSTDAHRDRDRALATLRAALDAGVNLFDTADAYCQHAGESGHNERLIAAALADWDGDRSRILVISKGGLTRPQGQWVPDGRARHLMAACESSLQALGLDRIPLYQLHAPDPRVPLATSVRALDSLKRRGFIDAVGLCNVTLGQLEEARQITEIASVQVELSPWQDAVVLSGLAAFCARHGIRLLAHRPLGGVRRVARLVADRTLRRDWDRSSPADLVLTWLRDLSPVITPLPGATRPSTAQAIAAAATLELTGDERSRLDSRFPTLALLRTGPAVPRPDSRSGEIILIVGLPASGKSTLAQTWSDAGWVRLNRDVRGGTLKGLLADLERGLAGGHTRFVLDNTYASRASRGAVIQFAARHGLAVRCVWMTATVEEAQVNACERMIRTYGRLLEPDEIRRIARRDPNTFAPGVLFRVQREFEPPDPSEGFSEVERVPFAQTRAASHTRPGILLWCDGVLLPIRARSPLREELDPVRARDRIERLRHLAAEGYQLVLLAWRPEIEAGSVTPAQVDDEMQRFIERAGVPMTFLCCPHIAGPPVCWCRSPLPGLGVLALERYGLDPSASICIGRGPHDAAFARRLSLPYQNAEEFFGGWPAR